MSDAPDTPVGSLGWIDLTVEHASELRNFYVEVAGWRAEAVEMGGYEDFTMFPAGGEAPAGGICHARGTNADLPACWMIYITVDRLDERIAACTARGGEVVLGPKAMGSYGRYCVIRDPAGAHAALIEPPTKD